MGREEEEDEVDVRDVEGWILGRVALGEGEGVSVESEIERPFCGGIGGGDGGSTACTTTERNVRHVEWK